MLFVGCFRGASLVGKNHEKFPSYMWSITSYMQVVSHLLTGMHSQAVKLPKMGDEPKQSWI